MKKEICEPKGYILLWTIVIIMFIFMCSYVLIGIGEGRWQCAEYSEPSGTMTCKLNAYGENTGNCVIDMSLNQKCVKEVWTHYPDKRWNLNGEVE